MGGYPLCIQISHESSFWQKWTYCMSVWKKHMEDSRRTSDKEKKRVLPGCNTLNAPFSKHTSPQKHPTDGDIKQTQRIRRSMSLEINWWTHYVSANCCLIDRTKKKCFWWLWRSWKCREYLMNTVCDVSTGPLWEIVHYETPDSILLAMLMGAGWLMGAGMLKITKNKAKTS